MFTPLSVEGGFIILARTRERCFSPLSFESFGLAGREVLDLVSSLVKKAYESLNIDFALLYHL